MTGLDKRTNQDLLREYFNRWRKIIDLEKNENYQKDKENKDKVNEKKEKKE